MLSVGTMNELAQNSIIMGLTAAALFLEAWYVTRYIVVADVRFLSRALATGGASTACASLMFLSTSEAAVLRFAALWELLGGVPLSLAILLYAARLAGVRWLNRRRVAIAFEVLSLALIVVVGIWPELIYRQGYGLDPLSFVTESVGPANGVLFWPQKILYLILMAVSLGLLLVEGTRQWRIRRSFAYITFGVVVGVLVLSQLLSVAGLEALPGLHMGLVMTAIVVMPALHLGARFHIVEVRRASQDRIVEVMTDAVMVAHNDGVLEAVNESAVEMLEALGVGRGAGATQVPLSSSAILADLAERIGTEGRRVGEGFTVTVDLHGTPRHLNIRSAGIGDDDGEEHGAVVVVRDISKQVEAAKALHDATEQMSLTFQQSPVGLVAFDRDLVIQDANPPFAAVLDTTVEELRGHVLDYESAAAMASCCRDAVLSGAPARYQGPIRPRSGQERWLECEASPLRREDGSIRGGMCIVRDLTEHRRSEELIERLAFSDTVTGLPNRSFFRDRARVDLTQAEQNGESPLVAIIDLDGFTRMNATIGHAAADRLLKEVGERLVAQLRAGDSVARWGGDEFAVFAPRTGSNDSVFALVDSLRSVFAGPWTVDGSEVWLTASMGIAVYPEDGTDAGTLLEHAEIALRGAKARGGDSAAFYAHGMDEESERRVSLVGDLHRALADADRQFELYYQPVLAAKSHDVSGCEALIRWHHPERGLVSPMEFLPVAEETGLVLPLGDWVLRTACRQAARWREQGSPLCVSVNLSARQLQEAELVEKVRAALHDAGLPGSMLELEVTETAVIADPATAAAALKSITDLGIRVALDDFGTGYSSLRHLVELCVDRLKIDRSFVQHLPDDENSAAVCRAVIGMAREFGARVTAEGVETAAQVEALTAQGCNDLQGYYFAKPTPAKDLERSDLFSRVPGRG